MYNNEGYTPNNDTTNNNFVSLADVGNLDNIVVLNDSEEPAEPAKKPDQAKGPEQAKKVEDEFLLESARAVQQNPENPTRYLVEGLLTPGLNILAGARKKGKSWFALDLALCVAGGEDFLGCKTEHGKVIYFALEDTRDRMKRRINTQLDDDDAPENLLISYSTRHTGEQFYKALDACLDKHQDTKLVIIDVLQKIRTPKEVGLTEYGHDYKDVGPLKKIADTHGVTMLVITHTRKTKDSNDKWNEIIGGTGVTSVADTMLLLTSNDKSKDRWLHVTGIDTKEQELSVQFNTDNCRWNYIGTADELNIKKDEELYISSPVVQTIKALIAKNGGSWKGTCTELLANGLSEMGCSIAKSESALARKLNRFDELFERDHIKHIRPDPNGGTAGRNHLFIVANAPTE